MSTYPNEKWPSDAAVEALDGTMDYQTGLPYIAKGTGPTSVPSLEVQYNRREQRTNAILAAWRQGMVVDEGDFKIGVYPLEYTQGGARKSFDGASGVSIPPETAKVLYLNSAGALVVSNTWPADMTSYLPLALVETFNGQTNISDRRACTVYYVPSDNGSGANDRRTIGAYCASVTNYQSDAVIFAYRVPENLTLVEAQVYCTAANATASVEIKENGTSVLAAAATPSAGNVVRPTIADADLAEGNNLTVEVTTDWSGSISDLNVSLLLKAPLAV